MTAESVFLDSSHEWECVWVVVPDTLLPCSDGMKTCKIPDFCHAVVEVFDLVRCCTVSLGGSLPTQCPKTLITNYTMMLFNIPEDDCLLTEPSFEKCAQ